MKRAGRIGLKSQMLMTMVAIAVVSVSVSIWTVYRLSKKVIQEQYVKLAEDTLSAFSIVVDQEVGNLVSTIRSVILSSTIDEILSKEAAAGSFAPADQKQMLEEIGKLYSQTAFVEGFFLFDNYGRYYMYMKSGKSTTPYRSYYTEPLDREVRWFRQAVAAGGKEIFVNGDVLNPENQEVFSIVKQVNTISTYRQRGVAVITIKKEALDKIYRKLKTEIPFFFLDDNGELIRLCDSSAVENDFYSSYVLEREGGEKSGYLYRERSNEKTGWTIVTGIHKNELYRENAYLISYIVVLMGIVAATVLLASTAAANMIYRPLQSLALATEELRRGKERIDTEFDDTEIGTIGNTLKEVVNRNLLLRKRIVETELSKKKAELLLLQTQINPHYLYNTLDSIYMLTLRYGAEDIGNMVLALSEMFKMALNDGKGYVRVSEELEYVRRYMEIMNYRFNGKFEIQFDVDEELLGHYMLKFLIQPFVENAILHGLEPRKEKGGIVVSAEQLSSGDIEFRIVDDGVGFRTETTARHGYGIRNVQERLQLIYGEDYRVEIHSEPGEGTTVVFRIADRDDCYYAQMERANEK